MNTVMKRFVLSLVLGLALMLVLLGLSARGISIASTTGGAQVTAGYHLLAADDQPPSH